MSSVSLVVLVAAVVMIAVELQHPGRAWPRVGGWWLRTFALNVTQALVVFGAGSLIDNWMRLSRPWSADALGVTGGALVGYLATTFVYYWWHRARHEIPLLWRWVHQIHHTPRRLEIVTAFYKHPIEQALNAVITSALLYFVIGLGPAAASQAVLIMGLSELVYHWNVKTPRWLGWFVQRPEMHCLHHARGVHAYNYADLPIWDMLFGTYRNPATWRGECGLSDGAEHRLGELLRGVELPQASA